MLVLQLGLGKYRVGHMIQATEFEMLWSKWCTNKKKEKDFGNCVCVCGGGGGEIGS